MLKMARTINLNKEALLPRVRQALRRSAHMQDRRMSLALVVTQDLGAGRLQRVDSIPDNSNHK